jgi:hypothetical protein
MLKFALVLVAGIAIGYFYGFDDAKKNDENVVTRVVGRVGGSNRGKYNADIDKKMQAAEGR